MLRLRIVGCDATCLDSSTSRFDVSDMHNEEKEKDTYKILLSILHIVMPFPATWRKSLYLKKVQKISTWFESICELGLRIRAIINSPACMIIKGEKIV
jgi:hypothetical protein